MKIFVVERERIWEFTETEWRDFVWSILIAWKQWAYPSVVYPPRLMLRCGTPTVPIVIDLANGPGERRFLDCPSEWPKYRWEGEITC